MLTTNRLSVLKIYSSSDISSENCPYFEYSPCDHNIVSQTSGYATWFTAGGAIRIAHYNVIDDDITRKL